MKLDRHGSYTIEDGYDLGTVAAQFYCNQLFRVGDQLIQAGGDVRYWAESPNSAYLPVP